MLSLLSLSSQLVDWLPSAVIAVVIAYAVATAAFVAPNDLQQPSAAVAAAAAVTVAVADWPEVSACCE